MSAPAEGDPWALHGNVDDVRDNEWARISLEFTNAGYREGISAGKGSSLQAGFDAGFTEVGAPIGRELGLLRGKSTALLAFLSSTPGQEDLISEVREIGSRLSNIRLSDIVPRSEKEYHERGGREVDGGNELVQDETLMEKRDMEGLEDMLANMNASADGRVNVERPTGDDVKELGRALEALCAKAELEVDFHRGGASAHEA